VTWSGLAWYRRLTGYTAHDDPGAATGNMIALVIAGNGPFYPLYAMALIGWAAWPAWLTMLSSPFFAAVPWAMRRNARVGRVMLLLVGTANTVWCTKLLGQGTQVDLFLLPCVVLAALLFLREPWWLRLPMLALPVAAFVLLPDFYGAALVPFSAADAARMVALNRYSVAVLTGFLGWLFSRLV
jgi:hypothetical protein